MKGIGVFRGCQVKRVQGKALNPGELRAVFLGKRKAQAPPN